MGIIHQSAVLEESEIPAARSLGLPVIDTLKPAFALPCPRLEGRRCGIYENRPRVCASYRCRLLEDLSEGHSSLDASLVHVGKATQLLQAVRAAMDPKMPYQYARRLANEPKEPSAVLSPADQDLRLRTTALELYLDKHFRNSKDKRTFHADAPMEMMDIMEGRRFMRSGEAIFGRVGDDFVALQIPRGRCYGMEEVTASVWNILAQPSTIEQVCATLVAQYDVGPDECRSDVAELIGELMNEGLVEVAAGSD